MNYIWEKVITENFESLGMANARNPQDYPWGFQSGSYFVLDDVTVFQWFSSPHEMLVWMQKAEPLIHSEADGNESVHAVSVQKAINELEDNNGNITSEIFKLATASMKDKRDIHWWGEFSELLNGDSEFAISLRSDFRESHSEVEEPNGILPISEEDKSNFVEFLSTYGF